MSNILVRLKELDMYDDNKVSLSHLEDVVSQVVDEYIAATAKFGMFRSRHEGVAIIEEEFLEFRDAAFWPHKLKPGDDDAYTEAKQLAAMAIRYMVDIGRE